MSRELFVRLGESQVIAKCEAEKVGISTIEPLPSGGVRLVCMSGHGAATMTRKLKSHLIIEVVSRSLHRPRQPLW